MMIQKLLEFAKSLVTDFQLKARKFCLKSVIWTWLKETYKVMQFHFSFCTRSQQAWVENDGLGQHTFRPTIFFSQHFEQRNCSLLRFFVWYTVLDDLFQMVACFYTVEQCSAINNLNIASALQLFRSGLCNLKLCVTLGSMQKLLYS